MMEYGMFGLKKWKVRKGEENKGGEGKGRNKGKTD